MDISALGQHATDTQKTKIFNQSNALQCQLDNWAQIQVLYMPVVAPICAREDACRSESTTAPESTTALKPENFQLWLPSQLDTHLPCNQKLHECEWELQYAQAHDALNDDSKFEKKHASKAKYNTAQDALTALAPLLAKVGWSDILCPLGGTDMRPMGDFIQGQSKGTHDIPWIWKTPGALQDNDKGLQDCTWWSGLASAQHFKRLADSEGSRAYANQQSALCEAMLEKFRQCWAIVPAVVAAELNDDGMLGMTDTDSMLTIEGPPPLAAED
ncbi:hypothetical protein BDR04DRAFT_1149102 [Suillus decipiens]|nr:hypothetical protein BDR04DRAFT_1149102 [Suillus decipiens]